MKLISDIDLYYNEYDMNSLAYSIKIWPFLSINEKSKTTRLQLYTLLNTQKLTADFCIKYILNNRYACNLKERNITDKIIISLQPHITERELKEALCNYMILYI